MSEWHSDFYGCRETDHGRIRQRIAPYGIPGFGMYGVSDFFSEEKQRAEDFRKMKSFYPEIARELQQSVEECCDRLEYEGSRMFDEYPDRLLLMRLTNQIADGRKELLEEAKAGDGRWVRDLIQVLLLDEIQRRRCRYEHRRRSRRFW